MKTPIKNISLHITLYSADYNKIDEYEENVKLPMNLTIPSFDELIDALTMNAANLIKDSIKEAQYQAEVKNDQ